MAYIIPGASANINVGMDGHVKIDVNLPSVAELEAQALDIAQQLIYDSAIFRKMQKYYQMYEKMKNIIDKIQTIRKIDRKIILLGAIKDTMNPAGTAINLMLNARTVIDKKVMIQLAVELRFKTLRDLIPPDILDVANDIQEVKRQVAAVRG